jgi:hypothetical protein
MGAPHPLSPMQMHAAQRPKRRAALLVQASKAAATLQRNLDEASMRRDEYVRRAAAHRQEEREVCVEVQAAAAACKQLQQEQAATVAEAEQATAEKLRVRGCVEVGRRILVGGLPWHTLLPYQSMGCIPCIPGRRACYQRQMVPAAK